MSNVSAEICQQKNVTRYNSCIYKAVKVVSYAITLKCCQGTSKKVSFLAKGYPRAADARSALSTALCFCEEPNGGVVMNANGGLSVKAWAWKYDGCFILLLFKLQGAAIIIGLMK